MTDAARGAASGPPARERSPERDAEKSLVKERVNLREIVAEVVGDLRSRGADDYWACCPFHQESTPSFHVRPSVGLYKCFGCGESGDVFSFVQKTRGVGFREALELLAQRVGVELGSTSPEERRRVAEARRHRATLDAALEGFRRTLMQPAGQAALAYIRQRGFQEQTLKQFDIGFIPRDLMRGVKSAALDAAQMEAAGFTAAFGGRLGFGIRDAHGVLVGFGARRLDDAQDGPKYVNTRETAWFNKGRLLYGLDKAARALARSRRLVVMEGYTDVMMAHQSGLDEAVATMGTSFTVDHLKLVRTRVSNLVLVFDGDAAGQQAAERAARMVLSAGLECRVLLLPSDMDPCDWFATHSRADFDAFLETEGLGSVAFLCRRMLAQHDAGLPGLRERVAREALDLCQRLEDPLRRESIVADVARTCGVDRNLLRADASAGVVPVARSRVVNAPVAPVNAQVRSQFAAVAGLASQPDRLTCVAGLRDAGALTHPAAVELLAIAEELLRTNPSAVVESGAWLEAAQERAPALRATLERALLPPPGVLLPEWGEAIEHLRRLHADEQAREARRLALARPDIAWNGTALKDVQSSLQNSADARSLPLSGAGTS
ncbi:MAG: DNA primase [Planctomycetota bacterium]